MATPELGRQHGISERKLQHVVVDLTLGNRGLEGVLGKNSGRACRPSGGGPILEGQYEMSEGHACS